jgi:hypothetical protein
VANPVTLQTLITRCRQRWNGEGSTHDVTDLEITDNLNVSLAMEVYDLLRQAVGDNYYRKPTPFTFTTSNGVTQYDLPADFLSLYSIDIYLVGTTSYGSWKINARRYTEAERNLYQGIPIGWFSGATMLYSMNATQLIFQQPSITGWQVSLNYVPIAPKLGAGPNPAVVDSSGNPYQPNSYTDTWDDVNGWSEIAVLDAARKCAMKKGRLDLVAALAAEKERLKAQVKSLLPLRNAGEPLRPQVFGRSTMGARTGWGDGWGF